LCANATAKNDRCKNTFVHGSQTAEEVGLRYASGGDAPGISRREINIELEHIVFEMRNAIVTARGMKGGIYQRSDCVPLGQTFCLLKDLPNIIVLFSRIGQFFP
jgi:hypothetical protein